MACIRKRRGKFVVDWRDGGGVRRWRTCDTREQAKVELVHAIQEQQQAIRPGGDMNVTLDDYATKWLQQVKATSKERTWEIYSTVYDHHIAPVLGGRKLRSIPAPATEGSWYPSSWPGREDHQTGYVRNAGRGRR